MTTVHGHLLGPAGSAPAPGHGTVSIVLIDYSDTAVIGFDTVGQTEILAPYTAIAAADGTWTVDLVPNVQIQLAGGSVTTAWRVTENNGSTTHSYPIIVPASGTHWVGELRTTLVAPSTPSPVTNLAVSGALIVGGTLTLDGTLLASPPNDASKFLAGDGTWRVGGGAVSSVNGLDGAVVLNAAAVSAIPVSAEGVAGGVATLDGSALLTPAQLPTALIRANRLDQFAAPAADVAMGGHKLTGGAAGTAGTDFAIVSQLSPSRDRNAAALGLLGQPFPYMTINNIGLGLTSGFLVLMLCMADAGTAGGVSLMLGTQGSGGTGPSNVCAFSQAGSLLSVGPDVTSQLSDAGNAGKTIRLALGTSVVADGQTNAYWGIFCQMTGDPKIGGLFDGLHLDAVGGNRPAIVIGGLSSVPSSIDVSAATTAGAGYWLAPTP